MRVVSLPALGFVRGRKSNLKAFSTPSLLLALVGVFLVFPSANYVQASGLPLSSLPELLSALALLPLIFSRWLRRHWAYRVPMLLSGRITIIAGLLCLGLISKSVLLMSGTYQGFPACYRAMGHEAPVGLCEKSYDNPLARFTATRVDEVIDFGPSEWNLSFMNSLRFNYYWWVAGSVLRERIPFTAFWRGAVELDASESITVAYVGAGQVQIGSARLRLSPSYDRVAREQIRLPAGRHDLTVSYQFDDGQRSGGDGALGPLATFRLQGREGPLPASGPPLWTRLLGWLIDVLAIVSGLILASFYWPFVKAQWLWLLGAGLAAVLITLLPAIDPPSAINGYLFLSTLAAGALVTMSGRKRRHLLVACAGMAIVILAHEARAHPSLTSVLLRDGGSDFLMYESFARSILETGSLRAGEEVFNAQPLSRYVMFFNHLVFGDGDGQIAVFARIMVTSALLWFGWRFRGSGHFEMVVALIGTVLLVTLVNSTVVASLIRRGVSEYTTWVAFPLAFTWLFGPGRKARRKGFAALAVSFIARTDQAPALLWLLVMRCRTAVQQRDRTLIPALGLAAAICLFPVLHNVYYGDQFRLFPTSGPVNLVLPPDAWRDALTDSEARRQIWAQLEFLLYGPTMNQDHVLAGGELQLLFRSLQLLWMVAVGVAVRALWRFGRVTDLLMVGLPLVFLSPHLFYQVGVYYPRHVVIGYLAMAAAALYVMAVPNREHLET